MGDFTSKRNVIVISLRLRLTTKIFQENRSVHGKNNNFITLTQNSRYFYVQTDTTTSTFNNLSQLAVYELLFEI